MSEGKKSNLRLLTGTADSRTVETRVRIELSRFAIKQWGRLPKEILERVLKWGKSVEKDGLQATRLSKGYHDEPLKGHRQGQRSVRLNRSWRLIYQELKSDNRIVVTIFILEINKHEY